MRFSYFLLVVWCGSFSNARKLPSFVQQCAKDDPKLDDCMKETMLSLRPYFKKGIPEMKLPSTDPFHVDRVGLSSGGSYKIEFTDVTVLYLHRFEVQHFHMDFANNAMEFRILTPRVNFYGNYSLSGKLLMFELEGSGYSESNYTDALATVKISGKRENVDGKEYLKFESVDYRLELGGVRIHFDDLFRNNPALTTRTNEVINENIEELMTELKPFVEKTIASVLLSLIKGVFDNYSIDELFL